jgi:hypothetical protein
MFSSRRSFARRAVLTLVWGLVAFAVGQFVLGWAVEHWLPAARDAEYTVKLERLRARQSEEPGRPLVLVLGSSRVALGLRADSLHPDYQGRPALVFNFGLTGGASLVEALSLRRLLSEGVRPDLLVLEVLPPTLNQPGRHPLEEEWFDAGRLRSSERGFLHAYHSDETRTRRQWLKRRIPCLWHTHHLRRLLVPQEQGASTAPVTWACQRMDAYGWLRASFDDVTSEQRQRSIDIARGQYATALGDFHLAEGPSRALDDILHYCRREGIPVALLLMPEGPTFRSLYPPSMRAGIDAHLQAVSREHDVPLIDAREWLPEEAFWDSHHLLPRGAAAFTERLGREALPPLLRNLPGR